MAFSSGNDRGGPMAEINVSRMSATVERWISVW